MCTQCMKPVNALTVTKILLPVPVTVDSSGAAVVGPVHGSDGNIQHIVYNTQLFTYFDMRTDQGVLM